MPSEEQRLAVFGHVTDGSGQSPHTLICHPERSQGSGQILGFAQDDKYGGLASNSGSRLSIEQARAQTPQLVGVELISQQHAGAFAALL